MVCRAVSCVVEGGRFLRLTLLRDGGTARVNLEASFEMALVVKLLRYS